MNEAGRTAHAESRWPPALAILAVAFLLAALPGRYRLVPTWIPAIVVLALLVPMAGVELTPGNTRWLRIERTIMDGFALFGGLVIVVSLGNLISTIVFSPETIGGLELLSSSIAIWAMNVLMASLLYWQVDRGGPDARARNTDAAPDWLFPQMGSPEAASPGWRPSFVDYLFLGFCTATAFSPTDVLPMTPRAKALMMIESTISLVTIVIVGARAVNILK